MNIAGTITAPSIVMKMKKNTSSPTVTYGTGVTFTATVTAAAGTAPPSAGSVDFFDNGTLIGHVTATAGTGSGVATFTYTTTAGQLQVNGGAAHTITATYTGGPGFGSSSTSGAGNAAETILPKALTVTGFHNSCGGCVKSFKDALKDVKGVTEVAVKARVGSAELTGEFDAAAVVTALNKAGFHVKVESK